MKILLLSRFFPYIGGRETIVQILAEELTKKGHEVAVFTPDMGRPSLSYKTYKYEYNLEKIEKVINEFKPDLISSHTFYLTPLVLEANKKSKVPFTLTVHGDLLNYGSYADKKMFLDMIPLLDKLIAVCDQGYTQLKDKGKIDNKKLITIKYGINTELFNKADLSKKEIRRILKLPLDKFIFVTPTRMTYYKGLEFLLNTIEKLPQKDKMYFLFATPPSRHRDDEVEYTEKIFSIISQKNLQKNVEIGFFDFNSMPLLYNACDAFVLPSMTEQLPISIMEAQASQIPVIATNVGGVSEIVINKQTGFLVNYGDASQLKDAIEGIYKNNDKVSVMVGEAREIMDRKYTKETMTKNYEKLFTELLTDKS